MIAPPHVRVLHITPYFAPAFRYGGPPRSVLGLCRALQGAGIGVEVITTAADGDAVLPVQTDRAVEYEGVPVRYAAPAFPRRFFGARMRALIIEALGRVDLCHVHGIWNVPEWLATRTAHTRGVPYVLSPRGMLMGAALGHRKWRKRLAYALFEHRNVRRASLLHATSTTEAEALAVVVPDVPVIMIPNGVDVPGEVPDPNGAGELRTRLGIPGDAFVVLSLGRIHPIKRLDLVLAAFSLLRVRHPSAHLVIAGPDEAGLLISLLQRHPADRGFVHVTGTIADADRGHYMSACDVTVQCSDAESFGLVTIEAMAAGKPVVVTRTCPWPEIEPRHCGYLVDQTPEAIADGLSRVASNAAGRREMGARALAYARESFAWPAIGRRMGNAYASVIASHRRRVA